MKHIRIFVLVGTLLVAAGFLLAPPAAHINLKPKIGFPPLRVSGYVTIEPDADNRYSCIVAESPNQAVQSCKDLDGVNEPKNTLISLDFKLPGTYYVQVILYRANGKTIVSNTDMIQVIGDSPREESEDVGPKLSVSTDSR